MPLSYRIISHFLQPQLAAKMGLEEYTEWDHNVTFDPKGLAYLFSGLTLSVSLIIAIYFLIKSASK